MEGKGSTSGGDHDKSLTQELLNLSESEALDPKTKDEAMNLAMKLHKKMKEIEDAAKKEEEEKKKAKKRKQGRTKCSISMRAPWRTWSRK
ncbi:hypothetical protein U9M48_008428 [Paspalum notatum var. saurae]|uniref:Uncharacterized protein n=1 Tax=Paspalum notatum var. saurae TaxID=547442 RepID=A0AAQ3SP36_PASNO